MKPTKYAVSTLIAVATISTAALASAAPLPPVHVQGEIAYLSGGVGRDEARTILAAAKDYPLALEFAVATHAKPGPKAEYAAGVAVTIKNMQGNIVLTAKSESPFMLIKLPTGRYLISAERHGNVERRPVWVTGEPKLVVFEWAS